MQEARFDRHFVRDLTWSRHQLEELAERRFIAAQSSRPGMLTSPAGTEIPLTADDRLPDGMSFPDLFQKVLPKCPSAVLTFCSPGGWCPDSQVLGRMHMGRAVHPGTGSPRVAMADMLSDDALCNVDSPEWTQLSFGEAIHELSHGP